MKIPPNKYDRRRIALARTGDGVKIPRGIHRTALKIGNKVPDAINAADRAGSAMLAALFLLSLAGCFMQ
jgi:hypothetical protein